MITRVAYRASRIKTFDSLKTLNQYLEDNRFPINLLYFRASWNPMCTHADSHIWALTQKYPIDVQRVDSDMARKIADYYGVRAEPEFVFCLYGDEIVRQIGVNMDGLEDKYLKVRKLQQKMEKEDAVWGRYGNRFEAFYKKALKEGIKD